MELLTSVPIYSRQCGRPFYWIPSTPQSTLRGKIERYLCYKGTKARVTCSDWIPRVNVILTHGGLSKYFWERFIKVRVNEWMNKWVMDELSLHTKWVFVTQQCSSRFFVSWELTFQIIFLPSKTSFNVLIFVVFLPQPF